MKDRRILTEEMDNSFQSDDDENSENESSRRSIELDNSSKSQRSSEISSHKEPHLQLLAKEEHKTMPQKRLGDPTQNSYSRGGTIHATTNTSKSSRNTAYKQQNTYLRYRS